MGPHDMLRICGQDEGREDRHPRPEDLLSQEVDDQDSPGPQDRGGDGARHLRGSKAASQEEGSSGDDLVEEGGPGEIQAKGMVEVRVEPEGGGKVLGGVEDPPHVIEGIVAVEEDVSVEEGIFGRNEPQKQGQQKGSKKTQTPARLSSIHDFRHHASPKNDGLLPLFSI